MYSTIGEFPKDKYGLTNIMVLLELTGWHSWTLINNNKWVFPELWYLHAYKLLPLTDPVQFGNKYSRAS